MTDSIQYVSEWPVPAGRDPIADPVGRIHPNPALVQTCGNGYRVDAYVTARAVTNLVGFGRFLTDYHSIAYINYMVVDPAYQRKGSGRPSWENLWRPPAMWNGSFSIPIRPMPSTCEMVSLRLKNGCICTAKKRRNSRDHPDPSNDISPE